jgi:hypothetical protein
MKPYTAVILVLVSTILGLLCYIVSDAQGVGRYRAAVAGLAVLASSCTLEFLIVNSVQS